MFGLIRYSIMFACTVFFACIIRASDVAEAQTSYVRTGIAPNQSGIPCVEERGLIRLSADGKDYEKRYVFRYPEGPSGWNGRLLIGAHGGIGGTLRDRDGDVEDTSETALDDVLGDYALDAGYAYASVDRDGIGGTREGLALTYAFTAYVRDRVKKMYNRDAAHVYLAGLSAGGAITRYAAEDPNPRYAGVILIAGWGGGAGPQLERQAKLAALWPEVDPVKHPNLPLQDGKVKEYARTIGTPVEARRFWPYVGSGQTLDNFKRTLERYGLTGLTDEDLKTFSMKKYRNNAAFMKNVEAAQASGSTGRITVPAIEVAGTYDDIVIGGILEYKNKVKDVSRSAPKPTPADMHRLYQVAGAWHISPDDDAIETFQFFMGQRGMSEEAQDWLEEGGSYIPAVQEALDHLDAWVAGQTTPPPDRTVRPGERLAE